MGNLIKKPPRLTDQLSLRAFHEMRNTVLFVREVGGLGDILMHRMIFEDIKEIMPDIRIVWAVPPDYIEAAEGHPFIDEITDCRRENVYEYLISYNTTTSCGRYEQKKAPFADKHRSDIWANHCGVTLSKHNMHITVSEEVKKRAQERLEPHRQNKSGPMVVFCPISAMPGKNLQSDQIVGVAKRLRQIGCNVVGLHKTPIEELQNHNIPTIWGVGIKHWMGVLDAADYVVSVDTASFHMAGGIRKPVVGIFTFIDGLVYGKYYPTAIIVQKHRLRDIQWTCGPCFNWTECPKVRTGPLKPCLTELNVDMIMKGIEEMFRKWPFQTTLKLAAWSLPIVDGNAYKTSAS